MNIYFYKLQSGEEELVELEVKSIFDDKLEEGVLFSDIDFDIKRSCFAKQKLEVLYTSSSYEEIINYSKTLDLERYRVTFVKQNDRFSYEERIQIMREISTEIMGDFDLQNPLDHIGITFINDTFYIGNLTKNNDNWLKFKSKPASISYGLPLKIARTIINIIDENDSVLDMCAGAGTVLLEGLEKGLNIVGYDINPLMIDTCEKNLQYYNFPNVIFEKDSTNFDNFFDTIILDLPYGVYIDVSNELKLNLIKNGLKNSNNLIVISNEKLSESNDFDDNISRCIKVKLSNFTRYIYFLYS